VIQPTQVVPGRFREVANVSNPEGVKITSIPGTLRPSRRAAELSTTALLDSERWRGERETRLD
jgi:hypothetical protein